MEEFITIFLSEYANKIRRRNNIKSVGVFHVDKEALKNPAFPVYTTYKVKVWFEDYETKLITIVCEARVSTSSQFNEDKMRVKDSLKNQIYDVMISLIHGNPKDFEDIILGKPDRDKFICCHRLEIKRS